MRTAFNTAATKMLNHFKHKISMRFFILFIFISLTAILVILLRTVTHARFEKSMLTLSFNVMDEVATRGFTLMMNRMRNMEIIDKASANLIKLNVVSANNLAEIADYSTHLMTQNQGIFSAIESFYFANQNGSFVFSKKNDDETILTEIINRNTIPPENIILHYDKTGTIINKISADHFSYQPQNSNWFTFSKKITEPTWLDVYHYGRDPFWGISVVSPVFNLNHQWIGAVSVNIRLDYLRRLLETVRVSPNGFLFIVRTTGEIIAFPNLVQYNAKTLMNIKNFKAQPEIQKSFLEYQNTKQNNFTFTINNKTYLAIYHPLYSFAGSQWLIGAVAPADDFVGEALNVHFNTMAIALAIFILGIALMSGLITLVTKPLKDISIEIEKIRDFKLDDSKPTPTMIKEINEIDEELGAMKKSLRSFQKYVPSSIVRQLIGTGEVARLGGAKKNLAILFSDIEKFTTVAEKMPPALLTHHLSEYFDALSKIIIQHKGTIDKYIGDAIMSFWGAPIAVRDPCHHAANAALLCIKRSNELNEKWKKEGKPIFITRMGLHLGDAIVGNIGTSERLNYTAIGDTVNIASRLVGINKIYGTQILVTKNVYEILKNDFVMRKIDFVTVKGRVESSDIYELLAIHKNDLHYDWDSYQEFFNEGFAYYQNRNWEKALLAFSECLKIYPEDTVAIVLMNRVTKFKEKPPQTDWAGDWIIAEK